MPFQKGNKLGHGRPRKPEIDVVRMAIAEVEVEKKQGFWKHAVQEAYKDNTVLNTFIKKFLPDNIEVKSYEPILLIRTLKNAGVSTGGVAEIDADIQA